MGHSNFKHGWWQGESTTVTSFFYTWSCRWHLKKIALWFLRIHALCVSLKKICLWHSKLHKTYCVKKQSLTKHIVYYISSFKSMSPYLMDQQTMNMQQCSTTGNLETEQDERPLKIIIIIIIWNSTLFFLFDKYTQNLQAVHL